MSRIGKDVLALLDQVDKWQWDAHHAVHMEVGRDIRLWVSSGGFFCKLCDGNSTPVASFGLIERHLIYWKFRRITNAKRKLQRIKKLNNLHEHLLKSIICPHD